MNAFLAFFSCFIVCVVACALDGMIISYENVGMGSDEEEEVTQFFFFCIASTWPSQQRIESLYVCVERTAEYRKIT
jgi:hypothetical protein